MKLEDLTSEQQKHFKQVVEYCQENGLEEQLEEATHIDFNCSEHFLVDNNKRTFMHDKWCYVGVGVLYQKPDKPWNFSQETKMKPEDLKCFKQVADVIGHEGAVKELQVVIDTVEDPSHINPDTSSLIDCFYWRDTPQSDGFWANIVQRVVPEPYKSSGGVWEEPNNPDNTLEEHSKKVKDEMVEQIRSETPVSSDDMVAKPSHYQLLPEYEVKDVMKALLDKIEASNFDMSYYEAGWYQQSMQYFLRFHGKNGLEDLEKGLQTMQFVVDSLKERN